MAKKVKNKFSKLLGIGFDNKDGHTRITKSDNYTVVGGSKDTHEKLQEKSEKFCEKLKKRGKDINDITPKEFYDIIDEIS